MRRTAVVVGLSIVVALAVAGCGGTQEPSTPAGGRPAAAGADDGGAADTDAEPAGTPAGVDVCTLLTAADAARVLNTGQVHAKPAQSKANATGWVDSSCEYVADNSKAGTVTVLVRTPTSKDKAPAVRAGFDRNKASGQVVDGVGDAAYWWSANGLNVMKGDQMIVVNAHFDKAASAAAAQIVADKL